MGDPVAEIRAKQQTKAQEWAAKGITSDPEQARARVRAARKKRPKARPNAVLNANLPGGYVTAVESVAARFDVSKAAVVKRFVEDGLRRYADGEELELAGLSERPRPNPFDPMGSKFHGEPLYSDVGPPTVDNFPGAVPVYVKPEITDDLGISVPPLGWTPPSDTMSEGMEKDLAQ